MSVNASDEYVSATPSPVGPVQTKMQRFFTPENSSSASHFPYVVIPETPVLQPDRSLKRSPPAKRKLVYPPLRVRRTRNKKVDFKNALYRVLRTIDAKGTISSKAMDIMNDMMMDLMERLARETASIAERNGKATLTVRDVQTATRILLPGQLGLHAFYEAHKAVHRFVESRSAH